MNAINLLLSILLTICFSIVIYVPIWQIKQNRKKK